MSETYNITYPLSQTSIDQLEQVDNDSTVDLQRGDVDPSKDEAYFCSVVLPDRATLVTDPTTFDSFKRFAQGMDSWYHENDTRRSQYAGIKDFHDHVMRIQETVQDAITEQRAAQQQQAEAAAQAGTVPTDNTGDTGMAADAVRDDADDVADEAYETAADEFTTARESAQELFSLTGEYDLDEYNDDDFELKVLKKKDGGLILEISLNTEGWEDDESPVEAWEEGAVWIVETGARGVITNLRIELKGDKEEAAPLIANNYDCNDGTRSGVFTVPQIYMEGNIPIQTMFGEDTNPENIFRGLKFKGGFKLTDKEIIRRLSTILWEIMNAQEKNDERQEPSKKLSTDEMALLKIVFDNMILFSSGTRQTPSNMSPLVEKIINPPAQTAPAEATPPPQEAPTPPPVDAEPAPPAQATPPPMDPPAEAPAATPDIPTSGSPPAPTPPDGM